MRAFHPSTHAGCCLTRVVLDGQSDLELMQVQAVMARIHDAVVSTIPPADHQQVMMALFQMAIEAGRGKFRSRD